MSSVSAVAEIITIAAEGIAAYVSTYGAELVALRDEAGRDLLWNGDPAFWTGRAPLLFPIVGRLKGDRLLVNGASYPMRQHGFARQSIFTPLARNATACRLQIAANGSTREVFPFLFTLDVSYAVEARSLAVTAEVRNTGDAVMPASFGFHPALRWPLPFGAPREAHAITFAEPEPAPVRRLSQGLLTPDPLPTPVQGRRLALRDDLFADDAVIFDTVRSRSLRYGPDGGRGIEVAFPDMPTLGLWTKPGAGFLCVEPWHGLASPMDFDGAFSEKPGVVLIRPDETATFAMRLTLDPA